MSLIESGDRMNLVICTIHGERKSFEAIVRKFFLGNGIA